MINILSTCLINFELLISYSDVENLLKARFIRESDKNYPKDALRTFAENVLTRKKNEAIPNDLHGEFYLIETNEKI